MGVFFVGLELVCILILVVVIHIYILCAKIHRIVYQKQLNVY